MTQVDFYILKDGADGDRFNLACRITEKARNAGYRVAIHTSSKEDTQQMDRLLWTLNKQSFIPHGIVGEAEPELNPILIGNMQDAHDEHDVLINLAMEVPIFFSRFKRLAECVDNDNTARDASRNRFRFYRDRGYPLSTHEIA